MTFNEPKLRKAITVALGFLALGIAAGAASAQSPESGALKMQPFPKVTVQDPARAAGLAGGIAEGFSGKRAVDGLGANLEAVARWYGMTGHSLREKLIRDRQLRVARDGKLFVIETTRIPPTAARRAATARGINDGELAPLDQTFKLNSKPGSTKTLYLNFRGQRLTGTVWNNEWLRSVIDAPPFGFEGSDSTFSDNELRRIQYIWQIVAEDYAPFDVNVTTEPVSQDRMNRDNPADQTYGGTVLITRSSGAFNVEYEGIAYLNSFGRATENISLVMSDNAEWNEKYIAETISHEAGHMLGLYHDGFNYWPYYYGHGKGTHERDYVRDPNSWAPIMGIGHYTNIVQFSRGEYPGTANRQDDLAVIQQYLKLRDDEAGNTPQTAAHLPVTQSNGVNSGTVSGVLTSASDRDLFAFTAGPGELTARVTPAARSPNADLVLSLLSDTGAVLASANPPTALNAEITFRIPRQGTYYLQVNGTGYSGHLPGYGYSAYGSIGNFTLTASYAGAGATPPVASLTATPASGTAPLAVRLDATGSSDDGEVKFVYWDFGDGTTDNTGSLRTTTRTYRNPGSYRASIRVVDDHGLSATASQTITVNAPGPGPGGSALTAQVTLNLLSMSANSSAASGTLFVKDQAGRNLPNATVRYSWSGLLQGPRVVTSSTTGTPILSLASSQKGCFVLTVTGITLTGYTYNAAAPATAQVCR